MQKTMRLIGVLLAVVMLSTLLFACNNGGGSSTASSGESSTSGESTTSGEKVTLTFISNIVGVQADEIEKIVKAFEEETGHTVEYSAPGESYESQMTTKMASNDMPDLFTTHGWSVKRYSEKLRTLNDQAWSSRLSDAAKSIVEDADGNIYVLPVDVDLAGMIYNKTVLKDADVDVDSIKTWDDFEAACQKIVDSGKTPIHIGGSDSWTIGQYFDYVAPSIYITNESKNYRTAFKDGTFDWNLWEEICQMMADWTEKGFFNKDATTSNYDAACKALANGDVAFEFYGNWAINEAWNTNPDADLGMMEIPANSADDKPSLIGGEKIAIGVWKDTSHESAALELINFFAKDENMLTLASSDGLPSAFKDLTSETDFTEYYTKFANTPVFNYFDREYLPSGMWDDFCTTGANILSGKANAVQDAITVMRSSYEEKMAE